MDPYLFQNFRTDDGDHLRAEFKAFKFPESNVVLFKGTVNVCLDRCEGVRKKQMSEQVTFRDTLVTDTLFKSVTQPLFISKNPLDLALHCP